VDTPAYDDSFRLASLIWTAEYGIVLARITRPIFPWPPLEPFVDEMVDRMMLSRSRTEASGLSVASRSIGSYDGLTGSPEE
jgi:hypothetical protein